MKIDKGILGVAGELSVAAELCRRGIYAQLTFGNQKRTDLLIYHDSKYTRVEVKCKQESVWPNCRGINSPETFLVFVDFANKAEIQRPDFYILSYRDWVKLVREREKVYRKKHPNRKTEIRSGCLYLLGEISKKSGKPYAGCSIKSVDLLANLEKWDKFKC